MKDHSVRGPSANGAPSLQRTLSEPFAASAPAGDGGEVDTLRSSPSFHADPIEQLAFELAWELEEAELRTNDLVTINRDKLKAIARRMVSRARPPAPAVEVLETLASLLQHVDDDTCTHENVSRGGAIWTICDDCGRKWADDRGGFKPHCDAEPVAKARALLSASPREMGLKSDGGEPGLNWELSDETKKQIAEIESNQRHAFANLNNIIAGCPSEPSPSSRSETAGEVGLNWQISREAKAQIEEIESNTRNALLNAHKIVAGQLPPSPDCSGCRPSGVQKEDATGGLK